MKLLSNNSLTILYIFRGNLTKEDYMFILQMPVQPRPLLPPLFRFPPLFGDFGALPFLRPIPPVPPQPPVQPPVLRAPGSPTRQPSFLERFFSPSREEPGFFLIPGPIFSPPGMGRPGQIGPIA